MKRLTFFILRVLNVKQTSLIRIGYFKPLGIFRNNLHNRRICQCLMLQIPGACLCLFWQAVTVNNNKRPEAHISFFMFFSVFQPTKVINSLALYGIFQHFCVLKNCKYLQKMSHPIYFVSLGPGDAELITLKSLHALQQADIIYCPSTFGNQTKSCHVPPPCYIS